MTEENKLPSENSSPEQPPTINKPETQATREQNMKNNGLWAVFIMLAILTAIFLGLSSLAEWDSTCVGTLLIPYAVLAVLIISAHNQSNELIEKATADENQLNEIREYYREIKDQLNIPERAKIVNYLKASTKSPIRLAVGDHRMYIWGSGDSIYFFPDTPEAIRSISVADVGIKAIPMSQIEYFSRRGEIFRENKISGGGSSIGGAVAGGLIAGETGAIIGSRKKGIKSQLITHDTRETFLNYFDNDERHSLFFNAGAHQVFNDLMPEKEFNIVNAIKSSGIIKGQINSNYRRGITDQLRELAKLRDDGIITEEEFNEKKKQLLDKIT